MPTLQQVFHAAAQLRFGAPALDSLHRELAESTRPLAARDPAPPPLKLAERLALDRVSFTYPCADRAVLEDVSLVIEADTTVGIMGPTGSGKTTLVAAVARLYDLSGGSIAIDGVDVRRLDPGDLRRAVALVPDDGFLFSASVHDNIAYARPDATPEEVELAAGRAQIHEFVRSLPEGYDTLVGERGLTLSGGQRQRMAIARALIADPRVLILDDATASVDATTEREIKRALREVMEGRTTLVIAHRLSTISLADRIVVMEGGRITAQGAHEELLDRSALYAEIVDKGMPRLGTALSGLDGGEPDEDAEAVAAQA
jgi:ATP-binding cassette subfamily B protein